MSRGAAAQGRLLTSWAPSPFAFCFSRCAPSAISFSYYGIRAIIALYMTDFLKFSKDDATVIVHSFILVTCLCSLLGGVLSDSYLGKYRTVVYMSFVYIAGATTLAVSSAPELLGGKPPPLAIVFLAFFLIALGVGGINPCLNAFVGDQFVGGKEDLLSSLYHLFYLSVNVGSIFSFMTIPLLREHINYGAAFGMPIALFFLCTIVFFAGRKHYTMVAPGRHALPEMWNVIRTARAERAEARRQGERIESPLLDYAKPICGQAAVDGVRAVLDVIKVFTPLPIFWALYDQQTSRWVFMAADMDRRLGDFVLTADQVNFLNPMLLLLLIPFFDHAVYPFLRWCGLALRPLFRMGSGMLLTGFAFIAAGMLQRQIEAAGPGKISIVNILPQYLLLSCGEIMLSITGLEFAYSQAPRSMKSVIMSIWFVTAALGNLLVVVIAKQPFVSRSYEFFFYAGLMFVFLFVFQIIACGYHYRPIHSTSVPAGGRADGIIPATSGAAKTSSRGVSFDEDNSASGSRSKRGKGGRHQGRSKKRDKGYEQI